MSCEISSELPVKTTTTNVGYPPLLNKVLADRRHDGVYCVFVPHTTVV